MPARNQPLGPEPKPKGSSANCPAADGATTAGSASSCEDTVIWRWLSGGGAITFPPFAWRSLLQLGWFKEDNPLEYWRGRFLGFEPGGNVNSQRLHSRESVCKSLHFEALRVAPNRLNFRHFCGIFIDLQDFLYYASLAPFGSFAQVCKIPPK